MPLAVRFEDDEVVFAIPEFHAGEWSAILPPNYLQFSIVILRIVASEELIIRGEIADYVLRRVDAKHF